MSEVSTSVHLALMSHAETRALVTRADIGGRIVATNAKWTTFVPFDEEREVEVATAAPGIALTWAYGADFGLELMLFRAGEPLGGVSLAWHGGGSVGPPGSAPAFTETLVRVEMLSREAGEHFRDLARKVSAGEVRGDFVRDAAAKILSLPAYRWLSPIGYVDTSIEALRELYPEAEDIELA